MTDIAPGNDHDRDLRRKSRRLQSGIGMFVGCSLSLVSTIPTIGEVIEHPRNPVDFYLGMLVVPAFFTGIGALLFFPGLRKFRRNRKGGPDDR